MMHYFNKFHDDETGLVAMCARTLGKRTIFV